MNPDPPAARSGGCTLCAGRQQCLVGRLGDSQRACWAPLVAERTVRKGELLLRQGQSAQQAFKIVKTGIVVMLCSGEDGVERPVALFGAGQPVGTTVLVQQPAPVSVRALTAGRICEIPVEAATRQGLLDREFLQGLAQSYVQTHARMAEWGRIVRIRGMAGQLAATLLQLASLQRSSLVRLPSHQVLADLLCTTRETIARTLGQLALRNALVRRDRWHCEIQREALAALAGGPQVTP